MHRGCPCGVGSPADQPTLAVLPPHGRTMLDQEGAAVDRIVTNHILRGRSWIERAIGQVDEGSRILLRGMACELGCAFARSNEQDLTVGRFRRSACGLNPAIGMDEQRLDAARGHGKADRKSTRVGKECVSTCRSRW